MGCVLAPCTEMPARFIEICPKEIHFCPKSYYVSHAKLETICVS